MQLGFIPLISSCNSSSCFSMSMPCALARTGNGIFFLPTFGGTSYLLT
jgi:hypothetical protein